MLNGRFHINPNARLLKSLFGVTLPRNKIPLLNERLVNQFVFGCLFIYNDNRIY